MTHHPGRRGTLLFLAGIAMPALARAQETPVPPVTTPALPPVVSPTPLPTAPARSSPVPVTAIDRTKAYYLFFDQPIDVASMRTLRRQLANLVEAGVSEITLVIDSAGGLLDPVLITYGYILALPVRIRTHAQNFVASAATLLFLAGQERSADHNARFVFHPAQAPVIGNMDEQQFRERLAVFNSVAEVTARIYRERTSLADQEIDRFSRETVIYTAEQALAAGVVQTVADLRIPGEGKARILFLD
jgi:ATP-dependent protease ClpP protease subunit